MFKKSDIRRVTIALEKTRGLAVFSRLGREGLLHLGRLQGMDAGAKSGLLAGEAANTQALGAVLYVMKVLGIREQKDAPLQKSAPLKIEPERILEMEKRVRRLERLRSVLKDQADLAAKQTLPFARALEAMGVSPGSLQNTRFVRMVFGSVTLPFSADTQDGAFALALKGPYVCGAALPRDFPRMLEHLKKYGFSEKTSLVSPSFASEIQKRLEDYQKRLWRLDRYAENLKREKGVLLLDLFHFLSRQEEVFKVMRDCAFSEKALFITGWADMAERDRLLSLLQEVCLGRFIFTCEKDPDAPVRLLNHRLFKPFELLVTGMGMPANSEIDPTPFAGILFVLVFGLMFGDLGQGLVLAFSGLLLRSAAAKRKNSSLGRAGGILLACGLWASLCGLLFGSFFSSEHVLPALWLHPSESIMTLFTFTILLGSGVIALGLALNIWNALANRDYSRAFFENKSLSVLVLYCGVVGLTVRYAFYSLAPALWEVIFLIVLPLLVFSLRAVLGSLFFHSKPLHDLSEYLTETVMEIVEMFLSLFANTVSFIRVGAFALSHAGLSVVTYALAAMIDPSLTSPLAVAVLVCGNIFIIGFEGLICGIQSMRLEYYEFFSKFYRGDGVEFSPFMFRTKIQEV